MTIESATYIADLQPLYPEGPTSVVAGDDHLRLLKTVLQNQFPNFTSAVLASASTLSRVDTLAATSGTGDAIILTPTPPLLAYADGQVLRFVAAFDNTGPVTIQVSGLVSTPLQATAIDACAAGDIIAGSVVSVVYSVDKFYLLPAADHLGLAFRTSAGVSWTTSITLGADILGHWGSVDAVSLTLTLPLSSSARLGATIGFVANYQVILQAAGADTIEFGGESNTAVAIRVGEAATIVNGGGKWVAVFNGFRRPADASQVEMETGTEPGIRMMSPLRVAQAVATVGSVATGLKSATTDVIVSAAPAPAAGQVLTAVDDVTATWQSPATSGWVYLPAQAASGTFVEFLSLPPNIKRLVVTLYSLKWTDAISLRFAIGTSAGYLASGKYYSQMLDIQDGVISQARSSLDYLIVSGAVNYPINGRITLDFVPTTEYVCTAESSVETLDILQTAVCTGRATTFGLTPMDKVKVYLSSGGFQSGRVGLMYME